MATFSPDTPQPRHVDAAGGPAYRVNTSRVTFKAVAEDTGGAYSLFEACTEPGHGVPAHFQRYEDEAFWVLEGTYTFLLDDRTVEAGVGDYAFVPRGTVHAWTNSGAVPGRMLIMVSPGGIHERFFAEVGELIMDRTVTSTPSKPLALPHLLAVAQKYGIEILSPPA